MGQALNIILLIDDDADDQLFFKLAIADIDPEIQCVTANNGADALRKLNDAETLPNLVFLDLNMPIMHGFECLQEIKKNQRLSEIPIFIFSTSSNVNDISRAKTSGASGYLHKPNDNVLLSERLREIFALNFSAPHRFLYD